MTRGTKKINKTSSASMLCTMGPASVQEDHCESSNLGPGKTHILTVTHDYKYTPVWWLHFQENTNGTLI